MYINKLYINVYVIYIYIAYKLCLNMITLNIKYNPSPRVFSCLFSFHICSFSTMRYLDPNKIYTSIHLLNPIVHVK